MAADEWMIKTVYVFLVYASNILRILVTQLVFFRQVAITRYLLLRLHGVPLFRAKWMKQVEWSEKKTKFFHFIFRLGFFFVQQPHTI